MDFKTLFFSWHGRSARKPYWIGIVSVEVIAFILMMALSLAGIPDMVAALITAYPRICVVTKRFHDIGRSGWWQLLPNIVTNTLYRVADAGGGESISSLLLYLASSVIGFGFIIWLGSLRGQEHANDFGSAPGVRKAVEVF